MNAALLLVAAVVGAALLGLPVATTLPSILVAAVVVCGIAVLCGAKELATKSGGLAVGLVCLIVWWDRIAANIRGVLVTSVVESAPVSLLPHFGPAAPPQEPALGFESLLWVWKPIAGVALVIVLFKLGASYLANRKTAGRLERPQRRRRAALVEPTQTQRAPRGIEAASVDGIDDELDIF